MEEISVARQGRTPAEQRAWFARTTEYGEVAQSYETALVISKRAHELGGRAFLVGGAVRDELLERPPKDFDLEIHGLPQTEVEKMLSAFAVTESTGKSFGTYKLPAAYGRLEVALPRRDSRTGNKHTDFTVEVLPDLGLAEAARRREYTIGAIYKDLLTGEMYDPYGGIQDLETRTLRMVDVRTFSDDALRVLRGAGFAARFGLTVDADTMRAMRGMVESIGALPKERVRDEWQKLLVAGEQPARGLEVLREAGVLERWYPELLALWQTPQDPEKHPEGDVGTHTGLVLNAAAELNRRKPLPPGENIELMYGALLHDAGKPATTKTVDGRIRALGHEAAGVKPAEVFLERLGVAPIRSRRVGALVMDHMRPAALYRERSRVTDHALRKLARDVGATHLRTLVMLAEADHRGRGPFENTDGQPEFPDTAKYHAWWSEQIDRLKLDQAPEQILWGRDLVESDRGWSPGQAVGEAVQLAEELALQGMTRETVLDIIDQAATPAEAITKLREQLAANE